jgi:hypothetical protein
MVRNWYQPTVYHHGEGCLLDENTIIIAIYIEHINGCTEVKGTFGRRDKQCKLADKLFNRVFVVALSLILTTFTLTTKSTTT